MLTLAEASAVFDCDPESGIVRWKGSPVARVAAGSVAGTSSRRYTWIKYRGRYYSGHKIVWLFATGEWPDHQIDHVNGNTFDNRLSNLRAATISENCQNRRTRKDNAAGIKGVQQRPNGLWRARIWLNGQSKNLGHFPSAELAHAAYVAAAEKHYGEFARAG